jgi:hypothetical protein
MGVNLKIALGVLDIDHPNSPDGNFEVAKDLEETYRLFSTFAEWNLKTISTEIVNAIDSNFENIVNTGQINTGIFKQATDYIEGDFRGFLDSSIIEGMGISGVPTQAALVGVRTKFKKGSAKDWVKGKRPEFYGIFGTRRPSFIDSGVIRESFRAWVEK